MCTTDMGYSTRFVHVLIDVVIVIVSRPSVLRTDVVKFYYSNTCVIVVQANIDGVIGIALGFFFTADVELS